MTGADHIRVGVADLAVSANGAHLLTSGLGSCVAIAIADGSGVGGLLHAMLPEAPADPDRPAKYVDSGVDALVTDLLDRGARESALTAKLAGGASMLDLGGDTTVGEKNVVAAERVLAARGIPIEVAETGGDAGRSVRFDPGTNALTIDRVDAPEETL